MDYTTSAKFEPTCPKKLLWLQICQFPFSSSYSSFIKMKNYWYHFRSFQRHITTENPDVEPHRNYIVQFWDLCTPNSSNWPRNDFGLNILQIHPTLTEHLFLLSVIISQHCKNYFWKNDNMNTGSFFFDVAYIAHLESLSKSFFYLFTPSTKGFGSDSHLALLSLLN